MGASLVDTLVCRSVWIGLAVSRALSIETAEDGLNARLRYVAKPLNKEIVNARAQRSKAVKKHREATTDA